MTSVAVSGLYLPELFGRVVYGSQLLDADGEKVAAIITVPKTGTLSKVGFRTGTVTTGDALKVSFQNVSATTGDPDGTIDEYRTIVIADGDDNVWKLTGIISSNGTDGGTKRSVTKGDLLSIVFEFNSFVAGNLNLASLSGSGTAFTPVGLQYTDLFVGSWTKISSKTPCLVLLYDDGSVSHIPYVLPATSIALTTYNSGSTPDEIALYFSNPFPCKVGAAWMLADLDGDADLVLYDSDGSSALGTISFDKDIRVGTSSIIMMGVFSSEITLAKDTNYRLSLKPTSVTNVKQQWWEVDQAAYFGQAAGGTAYHWSERTNAGAWTETATKRPFMGLILSALDDGVGGGGGASSIVIVRPKRVM